MPCSSMRSQAQVAVAECFGLVAELGDERLALLVVQALQRVEPIEQHARDDVEFRFSGLFGHVAAPSADVGRVAEQFLELVGGEGDLAGVEFRRLAGEQLHRVAVWAGHAANGQVGVFGVDIALEAVGRLVEMVVGIVDPVTELGRRSCSGHGAPSKN